MIALWIVSILVLFAIEFVGYQLRPGAGSVYGVVIFPFIVTVVCILFAYRAFGRSLVLLALVGGIISVALTVIHSYVSNYLYFDYFKLAHPDNKMEALMIQSQLGVLISVVTLVAGQVILFFFNRGLADRSGSG